MSNITRKIEELTAEELKTLKEALGKKGFCINQNNEIVKIDSMKSIVPVAKQASYEPSSAQRRLWLLDQMEGPNIAYNIPGAIYLKGEFIEEAFRAAYRYLIERHESLRTVFIAEEGELRQVVLDSPSDTISIYDLRGEEDKESKVSESVEKNLTTPFQLDKGPLVRLSILRVEDGQYLLLFNMHHIISDGWSMNIFTRDFLRAYNSFRQNGTPEMEPLRIHYKDYCAWQNAFLEGPEMNSQKKYWLEKFSGEIPALDLPADHMRPGLRTFNGHRIEFSFPRETAFALFDLCRTRNVSLFMLLLALIKTLIHRYTGQGDIIVGSPIAGRVHEDLEDQIGLYINTLALRNRIDGSSEFAGFLETVKQTCTGAFDNQDYPFDKLVNDLNLKRDISRSPLFDVMLTLQNNEAGATEVDGLKLLPYEIENRISKFDLNFGFYETQEGLSGSIEFNTDLFNIDRIKRMETHIKTLAASVIRNPKTRISDLQIIPGEEMDLLLNVFNDTKVSYTEGQTIVDLFEGQVQRNPDNIAVIFKGQGMTYRELNEKANQVGHYLRNACHIQPDDFVAVLLDRSERMIIALLGILKSGGAYIPVDPSYPADRIAYMLSDCSPKAVISEGAVCSEMTIQAPLEDIEIILKNSGDKTNPSLLSKASNIAYVIYTSGSTGKPKGAIINHAGVVNTILDINKRFGVTEKDSCLAVSSYSFDLSVYDIFGLLCAGGTTVIPETDKAKDPARWVEYLQNEKITLWNSVPALMQLLVDHASEKNITLNMRLALLSGDWIPVTLPDRLKKVNPGIDVISLGGATEASIWSIFYPIERVDYSWSSIPYGKPLGNQSFHILDKNLSPCPVGITGELYIGGQGVALGYLNKPELTAERFIKSPFDANSIIYKTGDVGRYLPDGNIKFLGRNDTQVKLRGYRIELEEIESALVQYKGIDSAVVIAKENSQGEKFLAAYYISEEDIELTEIRSFLEEFLPDYMIPFIFIKMEKLPLTSNGKADRNALLALDIDEKAGLREYAPPRNEVEKKLCGIWQGLLNIEQVGIHDNFFLIGGDSLLVLKFISKAKAAGLSYEAAKFFKYPTIAELAEYGSEVREEEEEKVLRIGEEPLNMPQRWFLDYIMNPGWAGSYMLRKLDNSFNITLFREAFRFLISQHDVLRAKFIREDGDWKQILVAPEEIEVPVFSYDFSHLSDEEQLEELKSLVIAAQFEMDLSNPPLMKIRIYNRGENKGYFLHLQMHHLIYDALSIEILAEDLMSAYSSLMLNGVPSLNYKITSAYEWFDIVTRYVNETAIADVVKYWAELPYDKIAILPVDYPENTHLDKIDTTTYLQHQISVEQTSRIMKGASAHRDIPFVNMLIAGLTKALAEYADNDWILMRVLDSGRGLGIELNTDLSRTVGWLTTSNNMLLKVDRGDNQLSTLRSLDHQIKQVPDKDIGLLRYHDDKTKKDVFPELADCQINFNYLGIMNEAPEQEGGVNGSYSDFDKEYLDEIGKKMYWLHPENKRTYLLGCSIGVLNGALSFSWDYSHQLYKESTVLNLTNRLVEILETFLESK